MKKVFLITCCILITGLCKGQSQKENNSFTYQDFNSEILKYEPIQREGVVEKRFDYAKHILEDTKSATKGNPENLNVTDFWNITTAFVILKEPKTCIELAFKKLLPQMLKVFVPTLLQWDQAAWTNLFQNYFFLFTKIVQKTLKKKQYLINRNMQRIII